MNVPTFFSAIFALFFCLTADLFAAETVRIAPRDGAPCILVDGKPARPRFFFGGPGCRPILLEKGRNVFDFDFSPIESSQGRGTLHFRFGTEPGTIRLDDFSITEKETGREVVPEETFETDADRAKWNVWADVMNGVRVGNVTRKDGALEVEILPEQAKIQADFHLHHAKGMVLEPNKTYHVHFTLDSSLQREAKINFYRPGNPYILIGSAWDGSSDPDVFSTQVRLAAASETNFVTFPIPSIWPEKAGEACDYANLDLAIEKVLKANPNALLVPRISMNAPEWWLAEHPEDRMVWHGISAEAAAQKRPMATPSSAAYREAGRKVLADAVRHMETKFGPHMAGYHPCGQNTAEWFTLDTWLPGRAGYSACNQRVWKAWVQQKYVTETALRQAWKRPEITFETVTVPAFELWEEARKTPILTDLMLRDYFEFVQIQMTDTVLAFTRAAREASEGKKLVMVFYGYSFEFSCASNGPGYSAHYALGRLLASPSVDLICSPQSYFDRQSGGGGQCMLVGESVSLAGKIYLLEDDTRTHLTPASQKFPGHFDGGKTLAETRELLRRNTAECACRNFATWWMDLGSAGWYADPELWKEMQALTAMDHWFMDRPTPYAPEVAVFVDENVMLRIADGAFTKDSIYRERAQLSRMGASYGQYFTEDLISGKIGKTPKLCVMLHADFYSPEEKAKITRAVGEKSLLWVNQKGISAEELRKEAATRGVHLFTNTECNVWANGPFIVLHASQDGPVTVTPRPGFTALTDELTHQPVTGPLELKLGETRVLRCR